jgi:hypothetical protein
MIRSEIRTALQRRRSDYSHTAAQLNDWIDQAERDIYSRRAWSFLRREATLTTIAKDSTTLTAVILGTITNGDRVLTIATASAPRTLVGKRIIIDGRVYRIVNARVSGANTIYRLDRPFDSATGAAYTATIVYDEYALPADCESLLHVSLANGNASPLNITAISPQWMAFADKDVFGQPTTSSIVRRQPIPAPTFGPTTLADTGNPAGQGAGTYLYWVAYRDQQTGAVSALSPSASFTTAGALAIAVTHAGRSDYSIDLYRSRVGGTVAYLVDEFDQPAFSAEEDVSADDTLRGRAHEGGTSIFMTLYPAPDSGYDMRILYQVEGKPQSEDDQVPLFGPSWCPVLLDGAEMMMLTAHDEQVRASSAQGRYEMGLRRMVERDRTDKHHTAVIGGRRRVRGRQTAWYGSVLPEV